MDTMRTSYDHPKYSNTILSTSPTAIPLSASTTMSTTIIPSSHNISSNTTLQSYEQFEHEPTGLEVKDAEIAGLRSLLQESQAREMALVRRIQILEKSLVVAGISSPIKFLSPSKAHQNRTRDGYQSIRTSQSTQSTHSTQSTQSRPLSRQSSIPQQHRLNSAKSVNFGTKSNLSTSSRPSSSSSSLSRPFSRPSSTTSTSSQGNQSITSRVSSIDNSANLSSISTPSRKTGSNTTRSTTSYNPPQRSNPIKSKYGTNTTRNTIDEGDIDEGNEIIDITNPSRLTHSKLLQLNTIGLTDIDIDFSNNDKHTTEGITMTGNSKDVKDVKDIKDNISISIPPQYSTELLQYDTYKQSRQFDNRETYTTSYTIELQRAGRTSIQFYTTKLDELFSIWKTLIESNYTKVDDKYSSIIQLLHMFQNMGLQSVHLLQSTVQNLQYAINILQTAATAASKFEYTRLLVEKQWRQRRSLEKIEKKWSSILGYTTKEKQSEDGGEEEGEKKEEEDKEEEEDGDERHQSYGKGIEQKRDILIPIAHNHHVHNHAQVEETDITVDVDGNANDVDFVNAEYNRDRRGINTPISISQHHLSLELTKQLDTAEHLDSFPTLPETPSSLSSFHSTSTTSAVSPTSTNSTNSTASANSIRSPTTSFSQPMSMPVSVPVSVPVPVSQHQSQSQTQTQTRYNVFKFDKPDNNTANGAVDNYTTPGSNIDTTNFDLTLLSFDISSGHHTHHPHKQSRDEQVVDWKTLQSTFPLFDDILYQLESNIESIEMHVQESKSQIKSCQSIRDINEKSKDISIQGKLVLEDEIKRLMELFQHQKQSCHDSFQSIERADKF